MKRESNEIMAAQKALDGVWGVDINPFAVAIARFRLIVAAVQACGIKRLKQAPGWNDSPGDRRQPAVRQPLESVGREGAGAGMARIRRGKLGTRDLCRGGQSWTSSSSGPGVSRRRRQSAVHHGEGSRLKRGLSGTVSELCHQTILAGGAVHRAVLRTGHSASEATGGAATSA